jgi:hypothetical protein
MDVELSFDGVYLLAGLADDSRTGFHGSTLGHPVFSFLYLFRSINTSSTLIYPRPNACDCEHRGCAD